MESKTYIANAIRTESIPASIEINQVFLHAAMQLMIQSAKIGDLVKRKIFYGEKMSADKVIEVAALGQNMAHFLATMAANDLHNDAVDAAGLVAFDLPRELQGIDLANLDPRLLHAGVGIFTEAGELVESLQKAYETGVMDKVNFGEEIGDVEWYQAIGFDATGVTEESCREKNIAKLRKRYPAKFDAYAAVNRDLAAERAILESDDSSALQGTKAA